MEYHPLPQPEEIPEREKEDAMGAYLMMFAAIGAGLPLPVLNLIATIIYYYINRTKSRFVRFHTLQSLWSQIPVSALNAVGVFWGLRILFTDWTFNDLFTGYLWMLLVVNMVYFIFSLIAAVKARRGQFYYFVLFGRLAYHHTYVVRESPAESTVNLPPRM